MELKGKTINETESVVKNYSLNSININKIQYKLITSFRSISVLQTTWMIVKYEAKI